MRINVTIRGVMVLIMVTGILALVGCNGGGDGDEDLSTPTGGGVAFVLTSNFETGSYSVIDLATRNPFNDLGGVSSDAIARFFGDTGLVYVVNRTGTVNADNIQVIDPQQDYRTVRQESVGNGTNPQDIAFVGNNRAYVSRLASAELLIIDATTLAHLGTIDLRFLNKPGDGESPDPFRMLVHDGPERKLVYLTLQHLDVTFSPVAAGEVVVIDPATDMVVDVDPTTAEIDPIVLKGQNPFSDLQFSAELNRILVSSVGVFTSFGGGNDGGIEAIDPDTYAVDPDFVVDENDMGGDITYFEIVSGTKGFAIVADANFDNTLVSFNPSTRAVLSTLATSPVNGFLPQFAINSQNELYLAVVDPNTTMPGVRIFNTQQDEELTAEPVAVGELSPSWIVFVEE
jgi:hypothetical protein